MALFSPPSPGYKTAASSKVATYAPSSSPSWFSSLFGSLFGGTSPVYKSAPPPVTTTAADDDVDSDADACSSTDETIVVL